MKKIDIVTAEITVSSKIKITLDEKTVEREAIVLAISNDEKSLERHNALLVEIDKEIADMKKLGIKSEQELAEAERIRLEAEE